jgi:ubiquinone/menaquinone biosynthesis C-methylase UbiE
MITAVVPTPVLDLGCGWGEFVDGAVRDRVAVGLDICRGKLARARASDKYRLLVNAEAARMPFGDGRFGAVLAVSVLEHVAEPPKVLGEVYRVTKPGGVFVGTVLLDDFHQHLFYPELLRRIGLPELGTVYTRLSDWFFCHRRLQSKEVWQALLAEAGFQLVVSKKIVSPSVTRLWDLLLAIAWLHPLANRVDCLRRVLPRPPRRVTDSLYHRLLEDDQRGIALFFVARKPLG